jgi:hypothetical protein
MHEKFFKNLESPLSAIGIVLWLVIVGYVFCAIVLFFVGHHWFGASMFVPIVAAASYLAFREALGFRSRPPRFANAVGLLHALVVVGIFIFVGIKLAQLSPA